MENWEEREVEHEVEEGRRRKMRRRTMRRWKMWRRKRGVEHTEERARILKWGTIMERQREGEGEIERE